MLTEDHRPRKWFPRAHSLLVMHITVFPRRNVKADLFFVLEHPPIASDVLDTGFRIAGNDQMSRPQIASAVPCMPSGHWKLEQINRIPLLHILHDRPSR